VTPQQIFLLIQIAVGSALVAYFLFGRKVNQNPSRLHLKRSSGDSPSVGAPAATSRAVTSELSRQVIEPGVSGNFHQDVKILNVVFMYNGHTFDAHEVIGVAPGSRFEVIREAFNKSVHQNPSQKEFLTVAMSAIIEEYKRAATGS
jgi:hypothetical protein